MCLSELNGRIHLFKDQEPLGIQQEEIRCGSTSKQVHFDLNNENQKYTKKALHPKLGRFFCQNSGEDQKKLR